MESSIHLQIVKMLHQIVLQNTASEATLVAMIAARESMLTKLRNGNNLENEGTDSLCSSLVAYASVQVRHICYVTLYYITSHHIISYRIVSFYVILHYIPLISRVRGPYGKLWTEFFPSFYGPSAKRAGHENKEGKNEDP